MVGRRYVVDELAENIQAESPESVFPLPLTPIEKYFLWDDRPEQPLSMFFHLTFGPSLDINILERCIAKVVERHPLLRATITGSDDQLCWTLSEKPFRFSSLNDEPPIVNGKIRPFNLRTEVGCRFWCETTPENHRIIVQVHHSVCDGVACRSVCIDILNLYASSTGSEAEISDERSPFYERFRYAELCNRFDFEHLGTPKRRLSTWQRIKNAWYFHFQPPTSLARVRSDEQNRLEKAESHDPFCYLWLDRDLSQRIFQTCQQSETKVNELAIALLFRTCLQWNRKHGDTRRNARLRILMPFDLRGRKDIRMPAANRLAFSFLGRNYSQCDDLSELIRSIKAELLDARETHLYLDLLNGIQLGCRWPWLMKWALRQHHSMATAVITYTGDLSRGMSKLFPEVNEQRTVGNSTLSSTIGAPPPRRNTNISMAVCINWGRICFSAMWNRSVFTEQDCREFLDLYKFGWQEWCETQESNSGVYAETNTASQTRIDSQ